MLWARLDSDQEPDVYKTSALPLSYAPIMETTNTIAHFWYFFKGCYTLPMQATFLIIESQAGQRLDKFLAEQCQTPRAQVQKWIKQGGAKINGRGTAAPHRFLKKDDRVEVVSLTPGPMDSIVRPGGLQNDGMAFAIRVIAEEPDYVVIEKPAKMLVHPDALRQGSALRLRSGHSNYTLADWLREHYPECAAVGDKPDVRPGIVHRLDKDASGLMVIARTQHMFEHLKRQFINHAVYKEYYALAHGVLETDIGDITFPIMRSTQEARMAARPISQGGKEAATEYRVIQRYTSATLLHIIPKTGRTHQIRVHFFALGYPLVGDPLYFNKKDKRKLDAALGRLFLHALTLRFTNLSDTMVAYHSELPEALQAFLKTLKPKV